MLSYVRLSVCAYNINTCFDITVNLYEEKSRVYCVVCVCVCVFPHVFFSISHLVCLMMHLCMHFYSDDIQCIFRLCRCICECVMWDTCFQCVTCVLLCMENTKSLPYVICLIIMLRISLKWHITSHHRQLEQQDKQCAQVQKWEIEKRERERERAEERTKRKGSWCWSKCIEDKQWQGNEEKKKWKIKCSTCEK